MGLQFEQNPGDNCAIEEQTENKCNLLDTDLQTLDSVVTVEPPLPTVEELWATYGIAAQQTDLNLTAAVFHYLDEYSVFESSIDAELNVNTLDTTLQTKTNYDYKKPILLRNIDSNTDSLNFDEIGFAENLNPLMDSTEEHAMLEKEINNQVDKITDFPTGEVEQLRKLLLEHVAAFGTKDSPARMSSLSPIECHLKTDEEIIAPPRWLGREQMEFLRAKLDSMVQRGLLRPTMNPHYGSQGFLVPKPKSKEPYRMVVDMRKLNKQTKRTSLMMPNLEQQISYPQKATYYGSFDILSGFDYLPVSEESRKYFVLVTCFGAFEFCGSPQGWINTPQLFQNRMLVEILQPIDLFGKPETGIIQWIDDSMLYSRNFSDYLQALKKFLQQMIKKNLRLNITKCTLLAREAEWCGRIINSTGWTYSPKYFGKILNTPRPTFTHELAQALYLVNWLSPAIPNLAELKDAFSEQVKLQSTVRELKKVNKPID